MIVDVALRLEREHHLEPEEAVQVVWVGTAEPELAPDPRVPVLGQRLGELNGEPVQLEVFAVGVLREQLGGRCRHPRPHGGELERHHIGLAIGLPRGIRALRPEEVGQAQPPVAPLPGEGEPLELGLAVRGEHDQVVPRTHAPEVPVDHGRLKQPFGLHALQPHTQSRPALGLH